MADIIGQSNGYSIIIGNQQTNPFVVKQPTDPYAVGTTDAQYGNNLLGNPKDKFSLQKAQKLSDKTIQAGTNPNPDESYDGSDFDGYGANVVDDEYSTLPNAETPLGQSDASQENEELVDMNGGAGTVENPYVVGPKLTGLLSKSVTSGLSGKIRATALKALQKAKVSGVKAWIKINKINPDSQIKMIVNGSPIQGSIQQLLEAFGGTYG